MQSRNSKLYRCYFSTTGMWFQLPGHLKVVEGRGWFLYSHHKVLVVSAQIPAYLYILLVRCLWLSGGAGPLAKWQLLVVGIADKPCFPCFPVFSFQAIIPMIYYENQSDSMQLAKCRLVTVMLFLIFPRNSLEFCKNCLMYLHYHYGHYSFSSSSRITQFSSNFGKSS